MKYTSAGTFTVPSGVTKLRVTCVGGGAGCIGMRDSDSGSCGDSRSDYVDSNGYVLNQVNTGGTTTFGTVSAAGGNRNLAHWGSISSSSTCGRDSCCSYPTFRSYTYTAGTGYNQGRDDTGTDSYTPGGAGYTLTGIDGTTHGTYGAGGGASGGGSGSGNWHTGASGFVTIQTISVTPGQAISATIGAGGARFCFMGYCNDNPMAGSAGAILVEYGQGVQ